MTKLPKDIEEWIENHPLTSQNGVDDEGSLYCSGAEDGMKILADYLLNSKPKAERPNKIVIGEVTPTQAPPQTSVEVSSEVMASVYGTNDKVEGVREYSVAERLDGHLFICKVHRAGLTRFIEKSAYLALEKKHQKLIIQMLDDAVFNKNKRDDLMFDARELVNAVGGLEFGKSLALPWCIESFPRLKQALSRWREKHGESK